MLSLAIAGTIFAGAMFPTILGLYLVATGQGSQLLLDGGYFFAFALLGGMIGSSIALFVSMPVWAFAAVIAWLSGVSGRDVWFASLIGGWTGFFGVHIVVDLLPTSHGDWVILPLAVITGQCGAGGLVLLAGRNDSKSTSAGPMRIGLRQLFGITTAVAIIAAASQLLKDGHQVFATIDDAAITQAAVIAVAWAAGSRRRASDPAERVSRVTGNPILGDSSG